ncbi:DUF6624 domain-containing protein [Brevundimonas sp. M20]|uniref:DUF6624 domain-containing protein n=1 Tax=Brevundimonas sp. M20 TaxID=2591463 RepID=UPI001146D8EC|nr:DUF6624 domain-containing protein [Brevundimonas sp. M20]QDH74719.1 hypothetical protein FKQ52_15660 [Brevundimonas sp. M20]
MLQRTMVTAAVAAVSILMAGFQTAPAPPQLSPALAVLAEDASAAQGFDYMALKAEGVDLKAMSDAVYRRAVVAGSDPRCLTEAEAELQENLAAAAEATDRAAFDDDRAAAAEAWAKWNLFSEGLEHGQIATEPPFKWVSDRYAEISEETNPRSVELLRRTAKDQMYRHSWTGGEQVWGPLNPGARSRVLARLMRATCVVDRDNTEWLKADVAANGWFTISASGARASSSAWLMAQHADRDRDFQRHVLSLMEPLVSTGEVSKANYAYLWDRIAVSERRPQRYGTQGRCVARNRWEPNDLEDPAGVEALREVAEIGSLAEYQAHMHQYCADFAG